MRLFIKSTFYFIIPVAISCISLELLLRNIPNDYSYKNQYLDKNADKIKILILGSSTSYYNINPAYLKPNSFNAANQAQSLDLDWEILKKYDHRWNNLKWIVLPISYTTLFLRLENGPKRSKIHNYIMYYDLNIPHRITDYSELLNNTFRININKAIGYYIYKLDYITCSQLGWGTELPYRGRQNLDSTGVFWAREYTLKNTIDTNLVNILKSIINYAKEKGVSVLLFSEPAYYTYIENLDSNQLNQTINTAKEMANSYQNVTYINLQRDISFTERDFYDGDHLDEFGAKKLTIKLDSLLTNSNKHLR